MFIARVFYVGAILRAIVSLSGDLILPVFAANDCY